MLERNDKPLLMTGPLVRATMDGFKTETRRIMKGSKEFKGPYNPAYVERHQDHDGWADICPYGKPGDLLWIRETWALASRAVDISKVYYKAHENASHTEFHQYFPTEMIGKRQPTWPKYKPGIHMPRWMSRLTLEIQKIRVERVQQIDDDACRREGWHPSAHSPELDLPPRLWFQTLWDKINGPRGKGWDYNPRCWVITYKPHLMNIDQFLKQESEHGRAA